MSERTRNPACTLLTVLVLVLAGREVQRTFFGDSDELAQDFTADELAGILSIRKGMGWDALTPMGMPKRPVATSPISPASTLPAKE